MNTQTQTRIRKGNRLQLWLLIMLFALPPMAAWVFYFNPHWMPSGSTNQGELIHPPRDLETLSLHTASGNPFDWQSLQGQWTLATLAEGRCAAECVERLIKIRQIRRASGANRQRIERLLILLPDASGSLEPPSLSGLEGTRLALADTAAKAALQEPLRKLQAAPAASILIIDPRVDLMMVHDLSHITSKQVLQDLEKLLKASQSWVKGGQYGHQ